MFFHIHIDPDEALVLRQLHAGLNGVVEEIAEDAAEIDLRGLQPDGDVGIRHYLDALCLCKGDFGVQDGVGHGIGPKGTYCGNKACKTHDEKHVKTPQGIQ